MKSKGVQVVCTVIWLWWCIQTFVGNETFNSTLRNSGVYHTVEILVPAALLKTLIDMINTLTKFICAINEQQSQYSQKWHFLEDQCRGY